MEDTRRYARREIRKVSAEGSSAREADRSE
jgi:hypothetical protein